MHCASHSQPNSAHYALSMDRAVTAPAMSTAAQSTQLAQLENTVEVLKSHFVQLLQHLPLTPGQQTHFGGQPQIAQLLSGPNSGSMSMPNAVHSSAPNVSLGNAPAPKVAATNNGGNVVVRRTPKPVGPGSSGKRRSTLNHSAAAFEPLAAV